LTAAPTHEAVAAAIAGLDRAALTGSRWFGGKGRPVREVVLAEAFPLPGPGAHVLAVVTVGYEPGAGPADRYLIPVTGVSGRFQPAVEGDGAWRALALAIAGGATIPALVPAAEAEADAGRAGESGSIGAVSAALVCRPAPALGKLVPDGPGAVEGLAERALGADQSNTSVVLGERLLLKSFRWLQPGLNPDLELSAYLAEEAGFPAVPRLGGYAELVSRTAGTATVAMLQEYVADGEDGYESVAETLTGWLLAPGEVSVEFATEIAADLGALTAGLHAALAGARGVPDFEPRPATRAELRGWHRAARQQLERAVEITPGETGRDLRELAPAIAEELTVFEALSDEPLLTRVHADYHLGQVLIAPDGFRIIDFEGEPTRPLEERRAHGSPLRDVASMLRSLDHVGRSAGRRAAERNGGPLARTGLDLDGWLVRSRERFLAAYRAGLRERGTPVVVDPALVRAFEIEKECYEFIYASTYLPDWLWAPAEGMRALVGTGGSAA
jgi:maltose alpha-D-glucosyltransferase/alpha-amylase